MEMIALYIYVAYDSIQNSDIFSITEVAKGTTYALLFLCLALVTHSTRCLMT